MKLAADLCICDMILVYVAIRDQYAQQSQLAISFLAEYHSSLAAKFP